MSKEDKAIARQLALADLARSKQWMAELGPESRFVGYDDNGIDAAGLPEGDGERTLLPMTIGERGALSKARARLAARTWRELTARYPKGMFVLCLLGYDQDPRELWEIPEACRYVRAWAKYDDIETADRLVGSQSATVTAGVAPANYGLGFLAGCGVFGEEMRQLSLTDVVPTPRQ